jgi:hypothetical protein
VPEINGISCDHHAATKKAAGMSIQPGLVRRLIEPKEEQP